MRLIFHSKKLIQLQCFVPPKTTKMGITSHTAKDTPNYIQICLRVKREDFLEDHPSSSKNLYIILNPTNTFKHRLIFIMFR